MLRYVVAILAQARRCLSQAYGYSSIQVILATRPPYTLCHGRGVLLHLSRVLWMLAHAQLLLLMSSVVSSHFVGLQPSALFGGTAAVFLGLPTSYLGSTTLEPTG